MAEIPGVCISAFTMNADNTVGDGSTCFVLPTIVVKPSQRFVVDSRAGMWHRGATVFADVVPVS
jgi:hypothetical protein